MEQINRVRPEASIMKILHPMTGYNVEVSEDKGMVAEKENIISLRRRLMGRRARIKEVKGLSRGDIWAEKNIEQRRIGSQDRPHSFSWLCGGRSLATVGYDDGEVSVGHPVEVSSEFPHGTWVTAPLGRRGKELYW